MPMPADKKVETGGDNKALVLIIIWGGLLVLILGWLKTSGIFNEVFLIGLSSDQGIIGYAYKTEEVKTSILHFEKSVDIHQITKSSTNPNLFYAATNRGVFFSQDSGKNWYPFSDLNKKIDQNTKIHKIVKKPSSEEMFVSAYKNNKGIIYQSNNGLFTLNKLLEFNRDIAYDLEIFKGDLYLGFTSGKILVYSLSDKNIKQVAKLSGPISNLKNVNDYVLFALSSSKIFVSFNGADFTQKSDPSNVKDIFVSQDGLAIYLITKNSFLKSLDFGSNYVSVTSLPIEPQKIEKAAASSINHLYVFGNQQFFESFDGGQSWKSYASKIRRTVSTIEITSDKILVGTKAFSFSGFLWENLFQII